MAVPAKSTGLVPLLALVLSLNGVPSAERAREGVGLEMQCGEAKARITVTRRFFEERRIPFRPEHLRLGANSAQEVSCGPGGHMSDRAMVISAGLQECGAESSVHGEWLVYSNQLLLFPAVVPTSSGSAIVRGATTVIPIECHYKRKQTVNAEPLTPTWLPMTSTISVFGLLHFSLRTMADDCTTVRSSSVYQQGEAVLLEASVEAPLHHPLTVYVDSCVATLKPDPLSLPSYKFITKHGEQDNRLCFSFQAFHFKQEAGEQMFISCHLRATLKQYSHSHLYKACFFHRPSFSWRATDGDNALCECCDSDDCLNQIGEGNSGPTGHTTQPDTEKKLEADTTVGPLHTLQRSHWTGRLSVNHQRAFLQLYN
ncbi:zona pellucida sperm-binding protein 3-like isoform X2 [Xiphias gladius]|uniref:zona pellucida sperm-binding protein 3-like isoform X2 n=1 Tax=Xiphias gladius TaxID=8245 RepID=UPI001A99E726|nr:zona pellucida sperm-binding protein 3-like isoform X2 [Xiphias gladius]